jgi:hypothetical protein
VHTVAGSNARYLSTVQFLLQKSLQQAHCGRNTRSQLETTPRCCTKIRVGQSVKPIGPSSFFSSGCAAQWTNILKLGQLKRSWLGKDFSSIHLFPRCSHSYDSWLGNHVHIRSGHPALAVLGSEKPVRMNGQSTKSNQRHSWVTVDCCWHLHRLLILELAGWIQHYTTMANNSHIKLLWMMLIDTS